MSSTGQRDRTWWKSALSVLLTILHLQVACADRGDVRVHCSRTGINVRVSFDTPFQGIIYSADNYDFPDCVYVNTLNNGHTSYKIPLNGCGTRSLTSPASSNSLSSGKNLLDVDDELFLENTIVIQEDPLFQQDGDVARRLRCVWRNTFEKTVNAKVVQVYEPILISIEMDNRATNTIVNVQTTRGPLALPAKGFVGTAAGSSSMVIYLKDPKRSFDANVLNCSLTDEAGNVVPLTDAEGCVAESGKITPFYKLRDPAIKDTADLVLYTYFKDLKISKNSNFNIKCDMEICFNRCGRRCQ